MLYEREKGPGGEWWAVGIGHLLRSPCRSWINVCDRDSSMSRHCPGKTGWTPKRSRQVRIQRIQHFFSKQNRSLGRPIADGSAKWRRQSGHIWHLWCACGSSLLTVWLWLKRSSRLGVHEEKRSWWSSEIEVNCSCLLLVMTAGKLSLWIPLFEEGRSAVCSGHRDKRDSWRPADSCLWKEEIQKIKYLREGSIQLTCRCKKRK
jgi:hypothetical protein